MNSKKPTRREHGVRKAMTSERGGALLVAMIMIFMMSLLGVSAMRGSTLEYRMATNSIQSSTTFQTAESVTEFGLNSQTLLGRAIGSVNGIVVVNDKDIDLKHDTNLDVTSRLTLSYQGEGLAINNSISEDGSGLMVLRFVALGESNSSSINSSATVEQGAYRIAPDP